MVGRLRVCGAPPESYLLENPSCINSFKSLLLQALSLFFPQYYFAIISAEFQVGLTLNCFMNFNSKFPRLLLFLYLVLFSFLNS